MNLLIVSDAYPPEIRSSSHLMVELAEGLRDMGHTVHVLTSWPEYNLDEASRARAFQPSTVDDGIHVIRVKTLPHHNTGFVMRGLAQLSMPILFLMALGRHLRAPFDGVIVYSPPLPLAFVGEWLRRRGVRYLLNVQDLFPQNAIDLGVMTNPLLVRLFRWMERRAYRRADVVTAHSEGNRDLLVGEHRDLTDKIRVLHNWVEVDDEPPAATARDFRAEWGLEGCYLALFAGVMGPSQALDLILDAAADLRDLPRLRFLLVGDGMEKARLEERALREGLSNVVFKPFVSREDYPALVAAADVGLVTLSSRNKTPVVPGKILGYMAGGKPVAAFLNAESDGHEIIRDAGCGHSCVSDRPDEVAAIIRRLATEGRRSALGDAGARYVREHFSKGAVIRQIDAWFRERP